MSYCSVPHKVALEEKAKWMKVRQEVFYTFDWGPVLFEHIFYLHFNYWFAKDLLIFALSNAENATQTS
jgi:hypothetical protein